MSCLLPVIKLEYTNVAEKYKSDMGCNLYRECNKLLLSHFAHLRRSSENLKRATTASLLSTLSTFCDIH